jgi:hypothetical protein
MRPGTYSSLIELAYLLDNTRRAVGSSHNEV